MMDWTTIQKLLVAILALPLVATVITAVFGPRFLRGKSHLPVVIGLMVSCMLSLELLRQVHRVIGKQEAGIGYETTVDLWTWASVPEAYDGSGIQETNGDLTGQLTPAVRQGGVSSYPFHITVTLRADGLTCIMLAMVTFVASLIAIYAAGYMHGDRGYWRFFAYIGLFVFSMTMLVSVSNFVLLYIFWEAVGLCSYLLIGFWYEKPEAVAAGKKAFLVNRIGDFGFALALFFIWTVYGTLNFHDTASVPGVLGQERLVRVQQENGGHGEDVKGHPWRGEERGVGTGYVGGGVGLAICLLLMLGACGKSAQIPLHVWLPDAMEGPTPVSALIHAATMVTAGLYMVARCTPLFAVDCAPYIDPQVVVAIIGGLTALIAGIIAMTQNDLKRVLAYSTISQLGYMFLALGTGSLVGIIAGIFHLFTHAFFKALLFLGAGSVMHAMGGVIDMRRLGGLRRLMPITYWTFLAGALALSGVWPLAGFFSKDAIIAAAYDRGHGQGAYATLFLWLTYAALFTAFLTALYTFRAFWMTFFGDEEVPAEAGHHARESRPMMTVPLVFLALGALLVGWIFGQPGATDHGFAGVVASTPSLAVMAEPGHGALDAAAEKGSPPDSHRLVATTSLVLAVLGIGIAGFLYLGDARAVQTLTQWPIVKQLYHLSYAKFFFDPMYRLLVVLPGLALAAICYAFDCWFVDGLVNTIGRIPAALGRLFRNMQCGILQSYALWMLLGALTLLGSAVWQMW